MIAVIGLGFVGLTTALGFSQKGNKVYGYDINQKQMGIIKSRKIPFFEKGLQEALENNLHKNFMLADSLESAIKSSNIIILCVGTPSDDKGKADLKYIKSALDTILANTDKTDKKVIVIKSTIPPSTTEKDLIPYIEQKKFVIGKDIFLANNPEFLREGYAWNDFINPDRIVIGTNDDYTKTIMSKIYSNFNTPVYFVSLNTGEFIKYLSNTFLSTLISYSNEMSMIADSIGGIDTKSAFKIFHEDKRWYGVPANMQTYAYPGCGFGGYCLPKDTQALIQKASEFGYVAKILTNVLAVNTEIKPYWIQKIQQNTQKDEQIAILGLSFKPDSDDIRETPALEIVKLLLKNGFNNIIAYDPISNDNFDKAYGLPIKYANSLGKAIENSNTIIITTGWKEFRDNKNRYKNKNIFDLRYVL